MTVADSRRAVRPDAPLVAHAFLTTGGPSDEHPHRPVVVVVRGADRDDDEGDGTADGAPPELPPGIVTDDLPRLDGWIVDLSLRRGRVTVVGPTDMFCSAPLVDVPPGWMADVAGSGLLAVVVRDEPGAPVGSGPAVPARATAPGAVLAATVPVCLSE